MIPFQPIKTFIRHYPITALTASLITLLFFFIGAVPESLFFNQSAIINGQWWRLFTSHLVHSDLNHLIWNLIAFMILSILIETHCRRFLVMTFISGVIAIDCFLWFNTLGVINYAGLSGVLNTLLVVALYLQWQQTSTQQAMIKLIPLFIYIASLGKIVIELLSQQSILTHINWIALPQAHLVGFITGSVLVTIHLVITKTGSFTSYPT